MTPVELSRTVLCAVRRAVDDGELDVVVPGRAKVAPPGPGGCGDYATNVALQLAGSAGRSSLEVAEILRRRLAQSDGIGDVVVTGPGFLNISLRAGGQDVLVGEILRLGRRYGHAERPTGQLVRLHAAHEVRAVVVMDALARILRSQGVLVRTSCSRPPDPEWVRVLGVVDIDAYGTPGPLDVTVRPVPAAAPASPASLSLGRDAARWALLHPAAHDRPRLTADHLVQRESNPLFRVRYVHARTRALRRNAADLGFHAELGDTVTPGEVWGEGGGSYGDRGVVKDDVRGVLTDHPRVLAQAAARRAPDLLARHLVAVADAALPFLVSVLPRGAEKPSAAHRARLALAEAVGAVLAGGLSLLGIDAPEHL